MRILENLQKVTSVSSCEFCELIHSGYSVKHQLRKTFTQNKSSCNSTKKEIHRKSVQIRRFFWYVFLPAGKYGPENEHGKIWTRKSLVFGHLSHSDTSWQLF